MTLYYKEAVDYKSRYINIKIILSIFLTVCLVGWLVAGSECNAIFYSLSFLPSVLPSSQNPYANAHSQSTHH